MIEEFVRKGTVLEKFQFRIFPISSVSFVVHFISAFSLKYVGK